MPNFTGTSGNDVIEGTSGADTMTGLAGNDIYYVNSAGDLVVESSGQGTDTVRSTISYLLAANIEQLRLLGTANINATGNNLDNLLVGNSGNNVIDGGTGGDTMKGGDGNDIFYVNSSRDTVIELGGEGTDTVRSEVSYTLAANVEQLRLLGTASINATGNSLANLLVGNTGNNILDGKAGADTMKGGEGNDIYYVDNAGDVVVELGGEGTDTVRTTVTYALGDNVEQLRLLGSANINGSGNALNNLLVGNSGNNALNGKAGADTMQGGLGNDTYYVDNAGDTVVEEASAGTDTIRTTISLTLADNVERGVVNGAAGLTLTGNALGNELVGGSGADTLIGLSGNDTLKGGTGADTMIGGTGNDGYYVDNPGDVVDETDGDGIDTVYTAITYTMSADIENGTIVNAAGDHLTGNALGNVLTGGAGNDAIWGGAGNDTINAGTGNDLMFGELGNDTFYVDSFADLVTEVNGQGTDTVLTSLSGYTLVDNVENGTLLIAGAIAGNGLNNVLTGTSGNDTLSGVGGNDTINGGGGIDTLSGGDGNDLLNGGDANDTVNGGNGNDTLDGGTGADSLFGGLDSDTYYIDNPGDVADETGDVVGYDRVYLSISAYTLPTGIEQGVLQIAGELIGNAASNLLDGSDGNDVLSGLGFNDTLRGYGGNDELFGGDDSDDLYGGTGDDVMHGGAGDDSYYVDSAGDVVDESGGNGLDRVYSQLEVYTLPTGVEYGTLDRLAGGWLIGNQADNALQTYYGNSVLEGLGGNDILYASSGNDSLYGGDGNDTLTGGAGADSLWGDAGSDVFKYDAADAGASTIAAWDTIGDLNPGADKIDLSGIDANQTVGGNQAFSFTASPTGAAGQIWWVTVIEGVLYTVYADVNGGGADMRIDVYTTSLSTSDFFF